MGKQSRKQKSATPTKYVNSITDRENLTRVLLSKLAEHQLTVVSAKELRALLPKIKEYVDFGERSEIEIDITSLGCRLYVLLPKYVAEQPVMRLEPLRS